MKEVTFLNLTNGIEAWIPNCHYLRIASTDLEQKNYDRVLGELSYDFLMYAATGYICNIYDFSSHKPFSRALYQGVPFIDYCLHRCWREEIKETYVKKCKVTDYFSTVYAQISKTSLRQMEYVKRFYTDTPIIIVSKGGKTVFDGNYDHYKRYLYAQIKQRDKVFK